MTDEEVRSNKNESQTTYIHAECTGCTLPLVHVLDTMPGGVLMQCGQCKFVIKLEPRFVSVPSEEGEE